ncbi:serine threonine kinase [Chrysochromulina tobinii]|uniref:Serine threonine kinase n=1 Tax=Chrysochromulina tobinii TaxID=1460289 RepID=A0A0M0JGQ4_9EUKA|nr:serine threonine kinase [Chrysochromulina tobinii]|eukprot:KOO25796.1 serine threonine kinase [Chrysochromulina sp. CCMP291]
MAWVLNSRVELGSGGYGRVVQATETSTGRIAAAKVISTTRMKITAIQKEVTLMSKLKHPSIVELLGYEEVPEQRQVVIYMELAAGGELFSRVITAGILMEDQARVYFNQILEGVGFMHSMGVVHRDLKLENVLVDAHDHCKICDLGLAHEYQVLNGETQVTLLREVCGSKSYCAPEVLEGRGYVGFPVDVWSCGICLFAMLAGFFPLVEADGSDWRYERVKMAAAAQCSATHTIFGFYVRTCTLTTDASDLIDGMLIIDPANRPTIQEVLQGPWCGGMKGGESEGEDARPVYRELGAGLTAAQLEDMYATEDNGALRRPVYRGGPALGPPPMLCKQEQMFCADFHYEEHSS